MKINIKGLFGDSIVYGLGGFIVKSAQVFIIPIIFIYLNKGEFGTLDYFLNIKNILVIIYGFGILTSIFKYTNPDTEKDSSPFNGILVVLLISLVFILLQLILSFFFVEIEKSSENLFFVQAISVFGALLTIPLGILRQKRKATLYVSINLINTVLFLCVTYFLIRTTSLNYKAILVGQIIANIITFIIAFIVVKKYIEFKYSSQQFKQMLNFGFSILTTSLSFVFILATTRFFLEAKTSFDDVGLLGMAQRFSLFVGALLISPFALAWLPYVRVNFDMPNFTATVNKVFTVFSLIGLLFCFILQFVLIDVFLFFEETEYISAIKYVLPFSLSYFLQGLYYIFSSGIFLSDKPTGYKIIGVIGPLFNVILYISLINYISLGVVSFITLISFAVVTYLSFLFGNKIMKVNVFSYKNIFIYIIYTILFVGSYFIPTESSFSISTFVIKISFILVLIFGHIYSEREIIFKK